MQVSLQELAKRLGTVVRSTLGNSEIPVASLHLEADIVTDNGDTLYLTLDGAPPFTTLMLRVNAGEPVVYKGHPELET